MWREFTRETPGRPRLVLAAMGLALAGVTGMAWALVEARSGRVEALYPQSPPQWPIAFSLPGKPLIIEAQSRSSDGSRGSIAYLLSGRSGAIARAEVTYRLVPEDVAFDEVFLQLAGVAIADDGAVDMGPLAGRRVTVSETSSGTQMIGVGLSDGLAVMVVYTSTAGGRRAAAAFEAICGSITFKPWSIEP